MHEASLMTNLIHRIGEIARAEDAARVTRVTVWLGALSHMTAPHFSEHFKAAAAGTVAGGAQLEISVSKDTRDSNADRILLISVEVET